MASPDLEDRLNSLVTRMIQLTACQSSSLSTDPAAGGSGYTEFGHTSQPNSLSSSEDIDGIRINISSLVIGKVRESYISPECLLNDEDVIMIEYFIDRHMMNIITSCQEDCGVVSIKNLKWLQSMIQEIGKMLHSSFFLLSKIKHLLLIPLLQVYDNLIQRSCNQRSVNLLGNSSSKSLTEPEDRHAMSKAASSEKQVTADSSANLSSSLIDVKDSLKNLLILLFSFSVSPHEIQLFFDLHSRHSDRISAACSRAASKAGSPVKSISGFVGQQQQQRQHAGIMDQRVNGMMSDLQDDDYFVLISKSFQPSYMSSMPIDFFTLTSYASLSLPPIKSFPMKGFTFATRIRLESIVLLQKSSLVKDHRMFLFSFKTSASPPIGFSAYFSFPNSPSASSNDHGGNSGNKYLKLTISCFKGSMSPSLTHTLSFPFPLASSDNTSSSSTSMTSEMIPLVLTFCPTSLSLYLAGELIESNANDWSISAVKSPIPCFDRCFIGCPFSPQSKGNISNPNDSGFTGQLASIYLFSSCLSTPAVSLFSTLSNPSNCCPSFVMVAGSEDPASLLTSLNGNRSSKVTSNSSSNQTSNSASSAASSSTSSSANATLAKLKEKEKYLKEINNNLVCLYSPSSVNWPIVLQNVNASASVVSSSNAASISGSSSGISQHHHHHHHHHHSLVPGSSAAAASSSPALTSHSLIQGNLEVIQRNLLIDSMQSLNQGIDMMTSLLISLIREGRFVEFSQLFSFSLNLISCPVNPYFLESGVTSSFFRQILTAINSLPSQTDRSRVLSFPSLFLPSLLSILQTMMSEKSSSYMSSMTTSTTSSSSFTAVPPSSSSSIVNQSGLNASSCAGIFLQPFRDGKEIEMHDSEVEKVRKMRLDCIKQILELFIFNSFLWCELIPLESESSTSASDISGSSLSSSSYSSQPTPSPHSQATPALDIASDTTANATAGVTSASSPEKLMSHEVQEQQQQLQERIWKKREETLACLYSFISTQLLSMPAYVYLLKRKRRAAFLMQVFYSLKSHFYHRVWQQNADLTGVNSVSSFSVKKEEEEEEGEEGTQRHQVHSDASSAGAVAAAGGCDVLHNRKRFERRERIVSLIRSNILVFIKNLLTKASSMNLRGGSGGSESCKNSPGTSSSGSSTATAGTTVELLDAGSSSNGDNQSDSGKGGSGTSGISGSNNNSGPSSSASRSLQDHHLMESMSASSLLDDTDEAAYFEEETNCILNYLSIMSREVLQRENADHKSLLNLIDVLSLMNSVLIEIPCSMIPSFDARKGIQVLFQIINNTIRSTYETDPDGDEEKEVIRSLCLKILGSFLMRSTFKRKSLSMTSSHFSILYYMLSRDQSILTHSLYVNLMEITIEAPISSLYSLQSAVNGGSLSSSGSKKHLSGKNEFPDDDYYWSSSMEDRDRDQEGRASSACSSGKENGSGGSTIKIENPQMIKVIALLVVRNKVLADQFLKDLFTLLMDSRSNRRLILQMSVWQSWLIAFLRMDDADYDDKEKRKRESTVVSLFKLLLYHALRWEFGGWRVWIDSLAIIHSFLSREAFNKMYANFEQDAAAASLMRSSAASSSSSHAAARSSADDHVSATTPSVVAAECEEDEKPEDDRAAKTSCLSMGREAASHLNETSHSSGSSAVLKRRLPTPTYRIPAFKWSSIHVQLLDSLLASIITDINCFRKEALMRANLNSSPTGGSGSGAGMLDVRSESDTNESMILETLLMSSDIYVINIIHLISQLTDSTILDAGGLLPLLALATSSSSSSSSSNSNANGKNNSTESSNHSQASAKNAASDASANNFQDEDLMSENKATELLHQLVFCADYLIFNAVLSTGSSQVTSGNSISLAELEAEKNMSSGGLLRQILRLVSMVSVKRVLLIKEKERRMKHQSASDLSHGSGVDHASKENGTAEGKGCEAKATTTVTSGSGDQQESSSEASEDADSDEDINSLNTMQDHVNLTSSSSSAAASNAKRKFLSRYTIIDREEESDHLLLSVRDIQRLRATLYRSDPSNEKDRANSNFLALSTMYFLSVLLVSKYRDTLDVVQTACASGKATTATATRSGEQSGRTGSSDKTADLSLMEKSLFPTVQFLKEIITDFESFLSKSLLGSKGQVLLTKQLVKRIKSNDCSPLELVMLLCAQEFQNSLQKNAGLAFIELINEGRLLSISMKEHVIRVGIEADFILSRIEREERDRDTLFKRESYLIEEKREKESDLVQEVICNICSPTDGILTSNGPSFTLSVPCSASSFRSKLRGSKRKSFRDLEEFVSQKKVVLFKEDFLMQESRQDVKSAASVSGSTAASLSHRQASASTSGIESVIQQHQRSARSSTSSAATTTSAAGESSMHEEENQILKQRVADLLNKISIVERERDHAILQLQSYQLLVKQQQQQQDPHQTSDIGGAVVVAAEGLPVQPIRMEDGGEDVHRNKSNPTASGSLSEQECATAKSNPGTASQMLSSESLACVQETPELSNEKESSAHAINLAESDEDSMPAIEAKEHEESVVPVDEEKEGSGTNESSSGSSEIPEGNTNQQLQQISSS